MSAEVQE